MCLSPLAKYAEGRPVKIISMVHKRCTQKVFVFKYPKNILPPHPITAGCGTFAEARPFKRLQVTLAKRSTVRPLGVVTSRGLKSNAGAAIVDGIRLMLEQASASGA